jgi:hypothetical protein
MVKVTVFYRRYFLFCNFYICFWFAVHIQALIDADTEVIINVRVELSSRSLPEQKLVLECDLEWI